METVMKGAMLRVALAAGFVCLMDVAGQAQETSTSSQVKNFEIVTVEGNQLVVKLPEGTKALTVPDDFRFTVNGKQVPVSELKPGMKGTATITTQTTVTPVSVTEVKNGTVYERSAGMITVQTAEGFKRFSQGDLDKRGVKIVKDGKPVNLEDLNKGDKLSATIVTSKPPRTLTKQEVQASVSEAAPPSMAAKPAASAAGTSGSAAAPATAAAAAPAKTLPKTASSWPLLALLSGLSLATGLGLTIRRHARP
jgi:hypothetical protein